MNYDLLTYNSLLASYRSAVSDRMDAQDYLDYNEVLFSAHSCAIEGNSFSVDDTRELKEKGLGVIPQGKSLVEAFEILDHFRAYEYMLSQVGQPLSEELLREMHRLTTLNTLAYRTHGDGVPGEYTTVDMAAGDTVFGDHEVLVAQVPKLIEATQQQMLKGDIHPLLLAAKFHCFFEFLHPFRDGNGRVGRLMANFILLSAGHPVVIIPKERKPEYIAALRFYRTDRSTEMMEDFFLRVTIDRMHQELTDKVALSQIRLFY